jgi:hypothetical protein
MDYKLLEGVMVHRVGPTNENKFTLVLTPNNGYTINNGNSLISNNFSVNVVLNISNNITPQKITPTDMELFAVGPQVIDATKLAIIKRVVSFNAYGITDDHLVATLKIEPKKLPNSNYTFTLTTDVEGVLINGTEKTFTTNEFPVNVVKLAITAKDFEEISINREDMDFIEVGPQEITDSIFDIISKVFNIEPTLKNKVKSGLKISRNEINPYIFTLTTNPGYLINIDQTELPSVPFFVNVEHLIIKNKSFTHQSYIDESIHIYNKVIMDSSDPSAGVRIAMLSNHFD